MPMSRSSIAERHKNCRSDDINACVQLLIDVYEMFCCQLVEGRLSFTRLLPSVCAGRVSRHGPLDNVWVTFGSSVRGPGQLQQPHNVLVCVSYIVGADERIAKPRQLLLFARSTVRMNDASVFP